MSTAKTSGAKPAVKKLPAKKTPAKKTVAAKPTVERVAARAQHDPDFLAKALANPGLRATLPDALLPEHLRAIRKRHQFLNSIGDVETPITGDALVNVAEQLSKRGYGQTVSDLDATGKKLTDLSDERTRRADSYFKTLQELSNRMADASGSVTAARVGGQGSIRDKIAEAIDASKSKSDAIVGADEAVRGHLTNLQADAVADAAAGARTRSAEGSAAAQTNAQSLGDAEAAFLRSAQLATGQQRASTLGDIDAKTASDLSDLAKKRVDAGSDREANFLKTLLDLRGTEGDRALTQRTLSTQAEKAILDSKTELAKVKSQTDLAKWKARLAASLQREGYSSSEAIAEANRVAAGDRNSASITSRESEGDKNRTAAAKRAKEKASGKGAFTPVQLRANATKRDNAFAAAANGAKTRGTAHHITSDQAYRALIAAKTDDLLARAAIQAAYGDGVSADVAAKIRERYGIDIPRKNLKK